MEGKGGNTIEVGDLLLGDGGEVFVLLVELVDGLSGPPLLAPRLAPRLSALAWRKALKTQRRGAVTAPAGPNDAELRLT